MNHPVPAATGEGVQRIRGAVGPKVLAKSHELFRQDVPTILQELFQNARRAGAGSIAVEHVRGGCEGSGGSLTVRDDGQGVADFQVLLTFGDSRWEERLDVAENAAGMGFFSVASRGALVRSRGRRVSLDAAVFRGETEACVLSDPTAPDGTEITVPLGAEGERVADAVVNAARYLPLAVTFDGKPVEQADFLARAEAVVAWGGVRIGVMRDEACHWDFERRGCNPINFHGVVARFERAADRVLVREEDGPEWSVRFDVVDAPDLRLVLPTRDWVIVNPFARMLLDRAHRAVYAHIASRPTHALAFKQAKAARAMGIPMPDATIRLRRWGYRPEWDDQPRVTLTSDDPQLVLIEESLAQSEIASANVTLLAESAANPAAILVRGSAAWTGYPAYDRLARLERLDATATFADGASATVRADEGGDHEQVQAALQAMAACCGQEDWITIVAASVAITATIRERPEHSGQPGAARTWSAETGLAFTMEGDCDPMDSTGLVAAASAGVGRVAQALVEHFHHPDDDRDSGSDEQQAKWAKEAAYARAREALLPAAEAKLRTLLDEVRLERWRLRQADLAALIVTRVVQEDGTASFRITATALDGTQVTADTA
ncbi:MAG: hypothetical protein RQ966_18195 [Acetobacteraceae bacterium]|nr:hypothetical protein [Acetobacteraceae bacterium]